MEFSRTTSSVIPTIQGKNYRRREILQHFPQNLQQQYHNLQQLISPEVASEDCRYYDVVSRSCVSLNFQL